MPPLNDGSVIYHRFEIKKRIGSGAFGDVFAAYDRQLAHQVAIKVEKASPEGSFLSLEKEFYDELFAIESPKGIPRPISLLRYGWNDLLVLPLLGSTVKDLWKKRRWLSLKSICMIGVQMLRALEHIHRHGILHQDIKPDNMMTGFGEDANTVYLIDFGLARKFLDDDGVHYPRRDDVEFEGTPVFASAHVDGYCERSPRDDLESLMYSLIVLHKGKLPWCDEDWVFTVDYSCLHDDMKLKHREFLCQGMPPAFERAWKIVRTMDFGDRPRYQKLTALLMEASDESWGDDGLNLASV